MIEDVEKIGAGLQRGSRRTAGCEAYDFATQDSPAWNPKGFLCELAAFRQSSAELCASYSTQDVAQQLRQYRAVGHVGRRRHHRVDHLRLNLTIHADVCLHPELPLLALLRLRHLRVPLLLAILRRTGRVDGSGVHDMSIKPCFTNRDRYGQFALSAKCSRVVTILL